MRTVEIKMTLHAGLFPHAPEVADYCDRHEVEASIDARWMAEQREDFHYHGSRVRTIWTLLSWNVVALHVDGKQLLTADSVPEGFPERHASHIQSRGCGKDSQIREGASCSPTWQSLLGCDLGGLSGKMSPVFCPRMEDGILAPSSGRFANSGMGSRTECWTLSSCEWGDGPEPSRSADAGCSSSVASLSEVLETGPLPPRFSLSKKACEGILRRSQRRAKALPPMLKAALEAVAGGTAPTALAH
jgi:hypothetical protein